MDTIARRAREAGMSTTALVLRYLDEGLRRDEHPLIAFRDAAGGRRAALLGSRLDVWLVIETLRNAENVVAETAEYLGISEAQVRACARYYAFHGDEIDEWTERMHAIAEHEEDAWRREQAVLA
jgi:uncharacterized protein (DUF433 family)